LTPKYFLFFFVVLIICCFPFTPHNKDIKSLAHTLINKQMYKPLNRTSIKLQELWKQCIPKSHMPVKFL